VADRIRVLRRVWKDVKRLSEARIYDSALKAKCFRLSSRLFSWPVRESIVDWTDIRALSISDCARF
jgi:hypothetical protein